MIQKIKSQEEIRREKRNKQLILGGVMIFLLVVSTAGYALLTGSHENSDTSREENGVTFIRGQGGWITQIQEDQFGFRHLPSEVTDVSIEGSFDISEYNSNTVLYFTQTGEGTTEVLSNIGRLILRYQEACLNGSAVCENDLPTKTCADHILIWQPANQTKVYRRGNCVHLEGEQLKAADAFLYKLLKIT